MLGWFLYFIMACRTDYWIYQLWRSSSHLNSGILRILTIFEKKSLKVFATSIFLDSTLSLLTKTIVFLDVTYPNGSFDSMPKFPIIGDFFLIQYSILFFLSQKETQ